MKVDYRIATQSSRPKRQCILIHLDWFIFYAIKKSIKQEQGCIFEERSLDVNIKKNVFILQL